MRHYFCVVLVGSLVIAGCGSDDKHGGLPDAPLVSQDAPVDVPDQPGPPVALTVMHNGAPVAGVHTYFLNADSSVVATLDTDASGTVTAVMAAGGSVTAIDPFAVVVLPTAVVVGDNDLRTFMGVKPGDHLTLTQNDVPNVPITFTLNAKAFSTANTYDVVTSCGSGSLPAGGGGSGSGSPDPGGPVTLLDCHGSADILIIASELNNENNPILGALYKPDVTLNADGIVDVTDVGYDALADFTYSYMNAPPSTSFVSVNHRLATVHGTFDRNFGSGTSPGGGAATIAFQEPTVPGTVAVTDTIVSMQAQHHVLDRGAVAATYTLDMTGLLLPDLLGSQLYNPTTARLEWVEDTTGAKPDLTMTRIDVSRTVNESTRSWRWTVAAPYTPGQLRFPTLPTDVADWAPSPHDNSLNVVTLRNAKVPGGYDAVRAHVHDVTDSASFASATGRVVTVELQLGEGGVRKPSNLALRPVRR